LKTTVMTAKEFDFVDFGASIGGSIDFAQRVLGGKRPLGIDIDPEKVASMRAEGFDCSEVDVTAVDLPDNSVRFVVMSHFLEHLPSLGHVRNAIESAARLAREFLFIQGPFFDADDSLAARGLKFYWSAWTGHTCALKTNQLIDILDDLGLTEYRLMFADEVTDSDDSSVHPIASPLNQQEYELDRHPTKPHLTFQPRLFREIVCLVKVSDMPDWEALAEKVAMKKHAISADSIDPAGGYHPKVAQPGSEVHSIAQLATRRLQKIQTLLLLDRKWHYLRYLHLRDAVIRAGSVRSVLTIGADRGLATIALAIEFPGIDFRVADYRGGLANFRKAREIEVEWSLANILFDEEGLSTLRPTAKFDLVALTEVLACVDDASNLATAAWKTAAGAVFALVPLASDGMRSGHHGFSKYGASINAVESLFPGGQIRGCYWAHRGGLLKNELAHLSDEEIRREGPRLMEAGQADVIDSAPTQGGEASALSTLAHFEKNVEVP